MTVSVRLRAAYRASDYVAAGVTVRVGRRSAAMDALLQAHGSRSAVFVTAWNPYSRKMPPGWNARMQTALLDRLRRFRTLPADGGWRRWREAHVLAFGAPQPLLRYAWQFRQNAVVVVRVGAAARLVGSAKE